MNGPLDISLEVISQLVCAYPMPCGGWAQVSLLKSRNRKLPQVQARKLIWWLALRLNQRISLALLGRLFKRHDSTVFAMVAHLEANYGYYRATIRACLWALHEKLSPNQSFEMFTAVRLRENFLLDRAANRPCLEKLAA